MHKKTWFHVLKRHQHKSEAGIINKSATCETARKVMIHPEKSELGPPGGGEGGHLHENNNVVPAPGQVNLLYCLCAASGCVERAAAGDDISAGV